MNKKLKIFLIILAIGFLIYTIFFQDNNAFFEKEKIFPDNFFSISELHWTYMPLTYSIRNQEDCGINGISKIRKAFDLISNSTKKIVLFNEVKEQPIDIMISCYDIEKELLKFEKNITLSFPSNKTAINFKEEFFIEHPDYYSIKIPELIFKNSSEKYYRIYYVNLKELPFEISTNEYGEIDLLGLGGPVVYGKKIINASIDFYLNDGQSGSSLSFPSKEIHEILHTFGFDHYNVDERDIMYPYTSFYQSMNNKYVSCLKYIYSNGKQENCSNVNFMQFESSCKDGWFQVDGTDYCCPEPNMRIVNGYCDY